MSSLSDVRGGVYSPRVRMKIKKKGSGIGGRGSSRMARWTSWFATDGLTGLCCRSNRAGDDILSSG